MSSTFPTISGYGGPLSLKDFLQRYFFLHLRFELCPSTFLASPTNERVLFVRPTGGFAVVVYISLNAPPPPPVVMGKLPNESDAVSSERVTPPQGIFAPLQGRPLTSSVLRCPFWDSLFAQLGSAAAIYIKSWCPFVVQFEPNGGGLQVLGPPLKNAVPRAVKRQRSVSWARLRKVVRCENQSHSRAGKETMPLSSLVSLPLYRLNVSRLPLVGLPPQRTSAEVDRNINFIVSEFWRKCHGVHGALKSCCTVTIGTELVPCTNECYILEVSKVLVHLVFPYTLSGRGSDVRVKMQTVEEHLMHVLHCLLSGVCRMNIRGAAIKHTGFLEQRSLSAQRLSCGRNKTQSTASISELTVPEPILASYLNSLLEGLCWRAPHVAERVSFWGNTLLLRKLCDIAISWLQCGRYEIFPLSHFLHEVPVAKIPWLCGFYTKGSGRKRRSMIQQRVFLQLIFFIFQHIVPFLVRCSFHVTWSSKNPNAFIFIPKTVWARLVSREMRRVYFPRKAKVKKETNDGVQQDMTLPPMALERVTSGEVVLSKAAVGRVASYSFLGNGELPLIYSSVRFLLDRHKLRPIARICFANTPSLVNMADRARPPTSFFNFPAASAATAAVGGGGGRCSMPSTKVFTVTGKNTPNATVLREALRCLLAGVEEQRVGSPFVKLTNISHQDEYADIRSFVEGARHFSQHPSLVPTSVSSTTIGMENSAVVTMVRGDAVRCFDCLPQEAVLDMVERLVPRELYYTLLLTAIAPVPRAKNNGRTSLEVNGQQLPRMEGSKLIFEGILLHQCTRLQTVSGECVQAGTLPGIPKGWIVCEEVPISSGFMLRGDEVRAVLRQHLEKHLVVVDGKLYLQRLGIVQGSAVAMLLCDGLLETVDRSFSHILSQHEEPALLLRRVDDVLVVTLSRVAAARCNEALQCGWSKVGFFCQREKLQCTSVRPVPWCGLLWNPQTLEFSVEWARLASLLPHISVRPKTGNEPLRCSMRFSCILGLRTPLTALCRRINSKARVVQTLCEIVFLWSRFYLQKMIDNAMFIRPHVRTFLKPIGLAILALKKLVQRHKRNLESLGSFCDITDMEVRLCFFCVLQRAIQEQLPWMIAQTRRRRGALRRFWLLFLLLVQRKVEAAYLLDDEISEGSNCYVGVGVGAGGSESDLAKNSSGVVDTVKRLLLAEGDDTVIVRALAAVRFTAPRKPA